MGTITHRTVWRLAGPIIVGHISIPLLGMVDTAVIGQLPGAAPLAGLAIGNLIFSYIYWGFGFLRMSTTGLTAQALGSNNPVELRANAIRALTIGFTIGAVILILHRPLLAVGLYLVDGTPYVETLAGRYFVHRIWGAPAVLCNLAILGWLLGVQNTRSVLWLQLWMNGLNIVLDLFMVLQLKWGVGGAGIATAIAEWSAFGLGLWLMHTMLQQFQCPPLIRSQLWNPQEFKRLIAINRDLFLRTLFLISAFAMLTAKGAQLGTTVLAANTVLLNFQLFTSFGLDGFAHAVEALVGKAVGTRDNVMYRDAVRISTQWAAMVAVGFAGVYAIAGHLLIELLSAEPAVRTAARQYLPWLAVLPIVSVWSYQLDGIFSGSTRSREMRNSMFVSFTVYAGLLFVLVPIFGNHGIWGAFVVFMILRAITLGLSGRGYLPATPSNPTGPSLG